MKVFTLFLDSILRFQHFLTFFLHFQQFQFDFHFPKRPTPVNIPLAMVSLNGLVKVPFSVFIFNVLFKLPVPDNDSFLVPAMVLPMPIDPAVAPSLPDFSAQTAGDAILCIKLPFWVVLSMVLIMFDYSSYCSFKSYVFYEFIVSPNLPVSFNSFSF